MIQTERLLLRPLAFADAAFILNLLNQPSWLRFIGDKGVHTIEDACRYIEQGPQASYQKNGFGLYLTALKPTDLPIGLCGLINRESLPEVDIGFAFLPAFCGQGYAYDAATATLEYAQQSLGLNRVLAITAADNQPSIRLLQKLGLKFERTMKLSEEAAPVQVFAVDLQPAAY